MSAWHEIEGLTKPKAGEMAHGAANAEDVIVFNVEGELHAFLNRCGHMGAPLDMGSFKSGVIKCALHNAVFDVHTGAVRAQPRMMTEGMDLSKLPKEFVESMMATLPIMERVACKPLIPLPIEPHGEKIRVWL